MPKQPQGDAGDFSLLPERERHIAGYVDALPDGAAMDIKSLARSQPLYGQMAVGSALRALGVAGHLRHVRCLSSENGGQVRWVTRTFWSRTAHDNEWWTAFLSAEEHHSAPQEAATPPPPPWVPAAPEAVAPPEAPKPVPVRIPTPPPVTTVPQQRNAAPRPGPQMPADGQPTPAFLALAHLGRTDPRLALSAADCAALEQAASEWLARGVDTDHLTHALTAGLPASVDSPFGFVRRRLRDKLPPHLPATTPTAPSTPVRRLMVECTECGAPGRPEAFHDGLCRPCREPDPA